MTARAGRYAEPVTDADHRADKAPPADFRLAYAPGVMPAKWVRIFTARLDGRGCDAVQIDTAEALERLRTCVVDAALVRMPFDTGGLHAIPLYTETTVVVFADDHLFAAADALTPADLADQTVWHPLDDPLDWSGPLPGVPGHERPGTVAAALEIVRAGVGVAIMPQSLARLHHHRKLRYLPLPDTPASQVALTWRIDDDSDAIEELIGVVRGRTVNSSRGRARPATQTPADPPAASRRAGRTQRTGSGRAAQRRGTPRRGGRGRRRR